jgi:hypothetical protein
MARMFYPTRGDANTLTKGTSMQSLNSNCAERSTARGVMDRVRQGAKSQLSSQKDRATDGLGQLAQAVRQSTSAFRDHQQDTVAHYLDAAANRIEGFSQRIREQDLDDLMRDVQQFARRRPAIFIGSAFIVGALTARFLKSSRDRSRQDGRQREIATYGAGMRGGSAQHSTTNPARYAGGGV